MRPTWIRGFVGICPLKSIIRMIIVPVFPSPSVWDAREKTSANSAAYLLCSLVQETALDFQSLDLYHTLYYLCVFVESPDTRVFQGLKQLVGPHRGAGGLILSVCFMLAYHIILPAACHKPASIDISLIEGPVADHPLHTIITLTHMGYITKRCLFE